MDKYQIVITKPARKQLVKLSAQNQILITSAIQKLSQNPRPYGSEKLTGFSAYTIRIGNYRVIYEINDEVLIGHSDPWPSKRYLSITSSINYNKIIPTTFSYLYIYQ